MIHSYCFILTLTWDENFLENHKKIFQCCAPLGSESMADQNNNVPHRQTLNIPTFWTVNSFVLVKWSNTELYVKNMLSMKKLKVNKHEILKFDIGRKLKKQEFTW